MKTSEKILLALGVSAVASVVAVGVYKTIEAIKEAKAQKEWEDDCCCCGDDCDCGESCHCEDCCCDKDEKEENEYISVEHVPHEGCCCCCGDETEECCCEDGSEACCCEKEDSGCDCGECSGAEEDKQ